MTDRTKHIGSRSERTKKQRMVDLEVRGNADIGSIAVTSLTAQTASIGTLTASSASFATMTASQANIGTLTAGTITVTNMGGRVIQIVEFADSAVQTTTATMNLDDTPPLDSEGFAFISQGIEPRSATNNLLVTFDGILSKNLGNQVLMGLFSSTATVALSAALQANFAVNNPVEAHVSHFMSAGSTATRTFSVRVGQDAAGTTTFNGSAGARIFGTTVKSRLRIIELSPLI